MSRGFVLVVDDDPSIRETLTVILDLEGYTVASALNGRQALRQITENPPQIILLDMRMPVMNGWTFAAELKARGWPIPLVVMTAAQEARRWADDSGRWLACRSPLSWANYWNS